MLIAYVGRFNFIHDEEQNARALEKLGCKVVRFDEDSFNRNNFCNINSLLKLKPDFVFYAKLEVPERNTSIEACKAAGIKTVSWHPDLYFGMPRQNEILTNGIFKSDFVLSPDGGNQQKFKSLGINHHVVRQGINDEDIGFGNKIYDLDVVYIGSIYTQERHNLVTNLQKRYNSRFTWLGSKGTNEVRGKYLSDVLTSAKVIVGDSYPSDYYWSNRLYEVLGRGGNLIHPYVLGIENEYTIDVDFSIYERNNLSMIFDLVDKNLMSDTSSRRNNAIKKTKEQHSMLCRANLVLNIIKDYK
jgi:hypothetical protein